MLRRLSRLGPALAAFGLSLSLVVSPALAANTRVVFFGSPGTTTPSTGLGILTATNVTQGGAAAVDLQLTNLSPSQLTHVVIQGGDAAPDPLANPSFPAPFPICPTGATSSTQCLPSLPTGTSYLAAYVSPKSTVKTSCTVSSTSLSCAVSNMAPNDSVTVRVVMQPPTATGPVEFWFATSLKEGTSSSGSNQDTFFGFDGIVGTDSNGNPVVTQVNMNVSPPTCAEVATFFKANQPVSLANNGTTGCDQATTISSNATFNQGAFSQVGAFDTNSINGTGTSCAPGITSCFGQVSQAIVDLGETLPNGQYVEWQIVWDSTVLGNVKPGGVTHFLDNYDPNNSLTWVNIPFKQKFQCSKSLTVNCWVTTTSTSTSFEAVFRTPNNGWARGF